MLGPCRHESPVMSRLGQRALHRVGEAERMLLDDRRSIRGAHGADPAQLPTFEAGGSAQPHLLRPAKLRCGIVTCGGLCPGINNVVRGLVLELTHATACKASSASATATRAWSPRFGHAPRARSSPTCVSDIHQQGGTVLGTSRGSHDPGEMVD